MAIVRILIFHVHVYVVLDNSNFGSSHSGFLIGYQKNVIPAIKCFRQRPLQHKYNISLK